MIIIYKEIKNGKIELTKKELEELLEQARSEGYKEASALPRYNYTYYTPQQMPDCIKITCDSGARPL